MDDSRPASRTHRTLHTGDREVRGCALYPVRVAQLIQRFLMRGAWQYACVLDVRVDARLPGGGPQDVCGIHTLTLGLNHRNFRLI